MVRESLSEMTFHLIPDNRKKSILQDGDLGIGGRGKILGQE